MTVLPTRWRRKPAGIDMEQNYVTVTLYIQYIIRVHQWTLSKWQIDKRNNDWNHSSETDLTKTERWWGKRRRANVGQGRQRQGGMSYIYWLSGAGGGDGKGGRDTYDGRSACCSWCRYGIRPADVRRSDVFIGVSQKWPWKSAGVDKPNPMHFECCGCTDCDAGRRHFALLVTQCALNVGMDKPELIFAACRIHGDICLPLSLLLHKV